MDPTDLEKLNLGCNDADEQQHKLVARFNYIVNVPITNYDQLCTLFLRVKKSSKRQNTLDWDEYFMGVAFLAAMRSKDPSTQVGACIVNEENKRIVGVGYNGFPWGCSDDDFPWTKGELEKSKGEIKETKYLYGN